jgi:FkbM family methyltransferase
VTRAIAQPICKDITLRKHLISCLARPYVSAELPGWGAVYRIFVGGYESNGHWAGAGPRILRDKRNGMHRIVDLGEWADRALFFLRRWYDLPAALLLDHVLKPGNTVLDVGANYGHFTMAAAAVVGPQGSVLAVEPNPVAYARLICHVALNRLDQVSTEQIGLSNAEGELELSIPSINSGEASFAPSQYQNVRRVTCPVKTGDLLLSGRSADFIKIDVEGFELNVLQGLQNTLSQDAPLVLTEVVAQHLARAGTTIADLQAYLTARGYRAYRLGLGKAGFRHHLKLDYCAVVADDGDYLWVPANRMDSIAQIAQSHRTGMNLR